jgi:hypothetical protein
MQTSSSTTLSYDEAVEAYYRLHRVEGAIDEAINQPGRGASFRDQDGWRLRNINGDLAYVLDSGEFGGLADLPVIDD